MWTMLSGDSNLALAGLLGGLQMPELILILIIALIIFGPKSLPKIGGAIGSSIREFKNAVNKVSSDIDSADSSAETRANRADASAPGSSAPQPTAATQKSDSSAPSSDASTPKASS